MSEIFNSEAISRRKLSVFGKGVAFAAAVSTAALTIDAEAQTAGMVRRQERRAGRHERREAGAGRADRREERRTGTTRHRYNNWHRYRAETVTPPARRSH